MRRRHCSWAGLGRLEGVTCCGHGLHQRGMLIRLVVLSLEGQDSYLRILVVAKGAIELSSSSGGNSSELNAGDN